MSRDAVKKLSGLLLDSGYLTNMHVPEELSTYKYRIGAERGGCRRPITSRMLLGPLFLLRDQRLGSIYGQRCFSQFFIPY